MKLSWELQLSSLRLFAKRGIDKTLPNQRLRNAEETIEMDRLINELRGIINGNEVPEVPRVDGGKL